VGDPEPGVHRLRRTADHLAWAPGNVAHQVLVLLFETFARVRAHTDKELANCWIREQPVCEVVDDFRDGVVAAESLIERALRLAASRFRLAATRLCLAASRRCVRDDEGQAQQRNTNEGNHVHGHTYLHELKIFSGGRTSPLRVRIASSPERRMQVMLSFTLPFVKDLGASRSFLPGRQGIARASFPWPGCDEPSPYFPRFGADQQSAY